MTGFRSFGSIVVGLGLVVVAPLCSDGLLAQSAPHVQVSGGMGFSFPESGGQPYGVGGGVLLEYFAGWTKWVDGRLYGGALVSGTRQDSCGSVPPCAVSSQVGIAGAKIRMMIPIPIMSPFLELGAGVSAGAIQTRYGYFESGAPSASIVDEAHSGLMVHVPVTLGLAFGAHRQHDVSFDYFPHPGRDHVASMLSIGIGFGWR
jgi:hypothetical protein